MLQLLSATAVSSCACTFLYKGYHDQQQTLKVGIIVCVAADPGPALLNCSFAVHAVVFGLDVLDQRHIPLHV